VDRRHQGRLWHLHHVGQQGLVHGERRELTEVYYPDLSTPAVRDLQFVVTDGRSWVARETDGTNHAVMLTDSRNADAGTA
jgi:Glucodextranase, domain N